MFRRLLTTGVLAGVLVAWPFAALAGGHGETDGAPEAQPAGTWIMGTPWDLDGFGNTARIATTAFQKAVLVTTSGDRTWASRTSNGGASWTNFTQIADGNWKTFTLDVSWIARKVDLLRAAWKGADSALRYQRSTNGGRTWSAAVKLAGDTNGGEQVARSTDGTVAVTWWSSNKLKVRISDDNGQTFSTAKTIGTYQFQGLGFDPGDIGLDVANGTVVVTFWANDHTFVTRRSTDHGDTWSNRRTLATGEQVSRNEVATAGNDVMVVYGAGSSFYSRLSHNKGNTWGSAVAIGSLPNVTLGRPGDIWAVAYSQPDKLRYRQSSNGTTWSAADTPDIIPEAAFYPQNMGQLFAAPAIAYTYQDVSGPELLQVAVRQ